MKSANFLAAGALLIALSGAARAETSAREVRLGRFMENRTEAAALGYQAGPTTLNPLSYITLRGGGMVAPRGAGLVGVDVNIPSIAGLGGGFHTRIDADIIFKANFGGINTIIPVTVDQLYYAPTSVAGRNVYYGAGLGAILSGPAKFDGKLILGTEVTSRLGAEVNVHFTEGETLVTLVGRIHL